MILPGLLEAALGDFPVNKTHLRVLGIEIFHTIPAVIFESNERKDCH